MAEFYLACKVTADLSNMRDSLTEFHGPSGPFWAVYFDVGMFFGSTELTAMIMWRDPNVSAFPASKIRINNAVSVGRRASKQCLRDSSKIYITENVMVSFS